MTAALAFAAGLGIGAWLTWRDMIAIIRRLQARERQLRAALRADPPNRPADGQPAPPQG